MFEGSDSFVTEINTFVRGLGNGMGKWERGGKHAVSYFISIPTPTRGLRSIAHISPYETQARRPHRPDMLQSASNFICHQLLYTIIQQHLFLTTQVFHRSLFLRKEKPGFYLYPTIFFVLALPPAAHELEFWYFFSVRLCFRRGRDWFVNFRNVVFRAGWLGREKKSLVGRLVGMRDWMGSDGMVVFYWVRQEWYWMGEMNECWIVRGRKNTCGRAVGFFEELERCWQRRFLLVVFWIITKREWGEQEILFILSFRSICG